MSTAMMSAPSWASLVAWLRPWLRAAPVMKATLPATRPDMVLLLPDRVAGVDRELEAGHVPGLVGGEEEDRVADVARLDHLDREPVHGQRPEVRVLLDHVGEAAQAGHHRGVHAGRVDRVDPDALVGQLVGQRPADADDSVLGGGVRAEERQALEARGRAGGDDRPAAVGEQVRYRDRQRGPDAGLG